MGISSKSCVNYPTTNHNYIDLGYRGRLFGEQVQFIGGLGLHTYGSIGRNVPLVLQGENTHGIIEGKNEPWFNSARNNHGFFRGRKIFASPWENKALVLSQGNKTKVEVSEEMPFEFNLGEKEGEGV